VRGKRPGSSTGGTYSHYCHSHAFEFLFLAHSWVEARSSPFRSSVSELHKLKEREMNAVSEIITWANKRLGSKDL
jgi:hypothetical protein